MATTDPGAVMPVYSAGRRRVMAILLLSSVMLITLDLRGNAVFDALRSGFEYAFRPLEVAAEVVSRPVARVWRGIADVDELEAEVERLQEQLDAQRSDQIGWQNALAQNRELRELNDLESLASFERVSAGIIGESPSNFDQRVEIDRGSLDNIRVGMPVVNSAGLVGKITNVFPQTSIVMLVTDPQYSVPVKVIAEEDPTPSTTVPPTVPSGLEVDDVTTTTTTTSTTSTTTTIPVPADPDAQSVTTTSESSTTSSTTLSTSVPNATTTTVEPILVTRETGVLDGYGADRLPRVRFIADGPQFGGRIAVGDDVLTSGGSKSLAPPDIPVGTVANVIRNPGTTGIELEVDLAADLDRLNFLSVVLFLPATEAPALG